MIEGTRHSFGESCDENLLRNSARNSSGPGHFPDCIEDMAHMISVLDIGSISAFLKSNDILGKLRQQLHHSQSGILRYKVESKSP